ncbi:hypothetical protein JMUB3935_2124 [Leptotrichia trevisanii]|uniref:Uncharacterized protein n=1 Tax=Leptotrichia trevisanii TaxID=109328 RepID=A0A510KN89_9FUSO|nr:hypothetical protein [Leptotrichia trevisanii]BBM53142.1 hypothetical protein JMUB3935_2124 [Leptotrichia trevisanii]
MKKISKLILFLFVFTIVQLFSYQYFKTIKITGKSMYKQFFLTEDIYENSKNNLGDIRIIDKSGKEVPYVIETGKKQEKNSEKVVARAKIDEVLTKKDKMEFIVKFNSDSSLKDIIGNRLELIPSKNFYSEYTLLGSNNGTDWEQITSGEIYKTPDKANLTIEFSEKRYEFYKVVTSLDKGNIFSEAILKLSNNEAGKLKTVGTKLDYKVEQEGKSTILKIKSKFLPLKNIVLDVEDEFQRNYAVRSGDNFYAEGIISKVGEKSNLVVNLENVPKLSEIIVEIKNGDNSPLKINEVTGNYVPDRIVFRATEGEDYKITFGDESLDKPEYDIAEFADSIKERDEVLVGKLEKSEGNNISKSKDYTVYYNVFIGFVVIVLIGFMVRKIDKNKK